MLWFWVIVLVLLIGAIAVVASGRGDSMVDVYDDRPDVAVATGRPLAADDLAAIRFTTGVRGYRMDEVDALLARLQAEMIEREGDHVEVLGAPRIEHVVALEDGVGEGSGDRDRGDGDLDLDRDRGDGDLRDV